MRGANADWCAISLLAGSFKRFGCRLSTGKHYIAPRKMYMRRRGLSLLVTTSIKSPRIASNTGIINIPVWGTSCVWLALFTGWVAAANQQPVQYSTGVTQQDYFVQKPVRITLRYQTNNPKLKRARAPYEYQPKYAGRKSASFAMLTESIRRKGYEFDMMMKIGKNPAFHNQDLSQAPSHIHSSREFHHNPILCINNILAPMIPSALIQCPQEINPFNSIISRLLLRK